MLCLGRIRISYVNGVFYMYWRGIRYISALNPVYFGVTPYIGVKPYIFWRETLHRVKLSSLTLGSKPEQNMTHLINIKLQYLITNMMQFVTLTRMYLRLSILRISCFSYCIC